MEDRKPSRVEAAIVRLNQDPYLLAVITAIPYVGGSITQVITGTGQQIVEERNRKLFEKLSEHLATVEEQAIRQDYFETPEGFDLLIKALDESRKTRSEEKRDLFARILAGATSTDTERGNYSPEEYLDLVASLTVKELEVARTIYTSQQGLTAKDLDADNRLEIWRMCAEHVKETHGIDGGDLPLFLNRLHNAGLLDLHYVPLTGTTVPTYWASPAFTRLMKFLALDN